MGRGVVFPQKIVRLNNPGMEDIYFGGMVKFLFVSIFENVFFIPFIYVYSSKQNISSWYMKREQLFKARADQIVGSQWLTSKNDFGNDLELCQRGFGTCFGTVLELLWNCFGNKVSQKKNPISNFQFPNSNFQFPNRFRSHKKQ